MASAMKDRTTGRRKKRSDQDARQSSEAPKEKSIFANNERGLIDNPFAHMTPRQAMEAGRRFARDHGLGTKAELFATAGRVLNDPIGAPLKLSMDDQAILALEACPPRDILQSIYNAFRTKSWSALRKELFNQPGFWKQPKPFRATIMMLCNAAIVQGWCQAGTNGANLNWVLALLGQLKLSPDGSCDPRGHKAWIFAAVNASPYLSGAFVGTWLSDPLSEALLGRRAPIAISATAIVGGAIGSGFAPTWQILLLCRIIIGLGMGTKAAIVPVFAAEMAPANIRGSVVMNWQLFDAFGIFLGFTANLIAAPVGGSAWRWQLASAAIPAIVLLGQIYAAPESPRFLMKRADSQLRDSDRNSGYVAAYETLLTLRREPLIAAKELLYVSEQMRIEKNLLSPAPSDPEKNSNAPETGRSRYNNFFSKVYLIFTVPRTRRALLAAVVVMIAQQLCGINVLIFYSSTVFRDFRGCGNADNSHLHFGPLWLSWGIGLANFLFAIPAYWLIDSRGRRWLLITTLPVMALTMLATSMSYFIDKKSNAYAPVIGLFTYMFVALYSVGMGPVPFTYSAECFPLEVRMVGMSLAVFVNLFCAGILALFVPILTVSLGHPGLLGLFAGLNVLAFVLIFLFVPETGGDPAASEDGNMIAISLEELNYIFGRLTRDHVDYQYEEVFKEYFLKRYFPWDPKVQAPRAFYSWPKYAKSDNHQEDLVEQDNDQTEEDGREARDKADDDRIELVNGEGMER